MEKNLSGLTLFGVSVFIVALIAQPATSAELFTQVRYLLLRLLRE